MKVNTLPNNMVEIVIYQTTIKLPIDEAKELYDLLEDVVNQKQIIIQSNLEKTTDYFVKVEGEIGHRITTWSENKKDAKVFSSIKEAKQQMNSLYRHFIDDMCLSYIKI